MNIDKMLELKKYKSDIKGRVFEKRPLSKNF
jgi:hypothetical protein